MHQARTMTPRRAIRPALLVALAAACSIGQPAIAAETAKTIAPLDKASAALDAGQPIVARDALIGLLGSGDSAALSDAERARAYELLAQASIDAQSVDPVDRAVQEARAAMSRGELAVARARLTQATELASSAGQTASDDLLSLAADLERSIADAREQTSGRVDAVVESFVAGRYPEAAEAIAAIQASGVKLTEAEAAIIDRYTKRLADLESRSGTRLAGVDLSVLQPGVINRQDGQPGDGGAEGGDEPNQEDLLEAARRFEAQSLLAEANLAYDERRLNEALTKYGLVLGEYRRYMSAEQIAQAEDRRAETQILLQGSNRPRGGLDQVVQQRELAKQQSIAEFNNELAQAQRALESGDVSRSRDMAFQARLTLANARNLFSEQEFETQSQRVSTLLTRIDQEEIRIRGEQARTQEERLAAQAEQAEQARVAERDRKIAEAIDRVRALQAELRYREALQVVDEILFLDPINTVGLLLKETLTNAALYREVNEIELQTVRNIAEHRVMNRRAQVPPLETVNYPEDWPAISFGRYGSAAESEPIENRRVLATLEEKRTPIQFNENRLEDVIRFIEAVTELDMDVRWNSLEEISIERDTPVTLRLAEAPMSLVLDRVVEQVSEAGFGERADWAVIDGVLTIASDDDIRQNTTLQIYDVRDLIVEIPSYDEAPELDLNQALSSSQGGGGQSPFGDTGDGDIERLTFDERIEGMLDIITTNVDFDGWERNGGDTGRIQQLNGNLIITNTPKNHRAIRSLLAKLRAAQALQINIETRFLLVSQDFFEQIGFDLDVYFNADNNQVRTAQAGDPTVVAGDFFDFANGGLQRTVTGSGEETFLLDQNGNLVIGDDGQPTTVTPPAAGVIPPDSGWSPVGSAQNSLGITSGLLPGTTFTNTITAISPALGIAGQFLDDIQVDFLIEATQADRRSIELTAPRLTLTNGQTSNFYVATQQTFVSDLQPVVSDSAVGFDPTLDVVSSGVVMLVTGTVSADRRYVTIDIETGISEIEDFGQQPVSAVAGGQLVNSADTASFVQLPIVTVTRVQTTVTVPDQGTVLLGGQRLVTEAEVESGVPVLSKLPILNRFFSNRAQVKEESTLLVLIKPTILIQNEQEERNFPGLLDSLNQTFTD
ncbi:MAG: hypothetical protein AAGG07_04545 [Planctomycetota bacterium]